MGKFVELDGVAIVGVYDSDNGDMPEGLIPITEDEYETIRADACGFGYYDVLDGQVVKNQQKSRQHEVERLEKAYKLKIKKIKNSWGLFDLSIRLFGSAILLLDKQLNGVGLSEEEASELKDIRGFINQIQLVYEKESSALKRIKQGQDVDIKSETLPIISQS